ncbi:hypothetical protein Tco_1108108 [Tanacetum coccineum]
MDISPSIDCCGRLYGSISSGAGGKGIKKRVRQGDTVRVLVFRDLLVVCTQRTVPWIDIQGGADIHAERVLGSRIHTLDCRVIRIRVWEQLMHGWGPDIWVNESIGVVERARVVCSWYGDNEEVVEHSASGDDVIGQLEGGGGFEISGINDGIAPMAVVWEQVHGAEIREQDLANYTPWLQRTPSVGHCIRTVYVDSLPHAHAQTTKTYYKHQDPRIKKAQELKTKTFPNSDIKNNSSEIKLRRRLLASFQEDANYEHVGQDTRSQGGSTTIPHHGETENIKKGENGPEWIVRSKFEDELTNFMLEKKSHTKGIGDMLVQHRKELREQYSQILSIINKSETLEHEAPTFAITTRSGISTQEPPFLTPPRPVTDNFTVGKLKKKGPRRHRIPSNIQDPHLDHPSLQPSKSSNVYLLSVLIKKQK